jgi:hypothetical protein
MKRKGMKMIKEGRKGQERTKRMNEKKKGRICFKKNKISKMKRDRRGDIRPATKNVIHSSRICSGFIFAANNMSNKVNVPLFSFSVSIVSPPLLSLSSFLVLIISNMNALTYVG